MAIVFGLLMLAGVASGLLTSYLRRYALARSLIDIPNARSSHSIPIPRGGGVSVVVTCLAGFVWFWLIDWLTFPDFLALLGAGCAVALIGFLDDHGHVAARWRLLAHFAAAIWALICLGGLPPLPIFGSEFNFGLLGHGVALLYMVWLLNLYNFMDGIDGIASIEAISVCIGAVVIYSVVLGDGLASAMPLLLLSAAIIGFLYWNFPRARIFMGDACSGFIGIVLGVFSVQAAWLNGDLFWSWLILMGVFIVDATVTLLRRVMRGDKFYQAHRNHAYQFAARKYQSHVVVSMVVGAINMVWLFPVALAVAMGWVDGVVGLVVAYGPLVVLAFWLKAGISAEELTLS